MDVTPLHILLADDSCDDVLLFQEALKEIPIPTRLSSAPDGERLIEILRDDRRSLPDVIFLDLNMPRKTGYECLAELKQDLVLSTIPVVIISTSYDRTLANRLYYQGAQHYIHKPNTFDTLVKQLHEALQYLVSNGIKQPKAELFVIDN